MPNTTIRTIKLGTPREIKIKNCPNLETLTVESLANLERLVIENIEGTAKPISLASAVISPNDASKNFFLSVKSPATEEVTKDALKNLADVVEIISAESDVIGTVHASLAYTQDVETLRERFKNLNILCDKEGIRFADPEVERVLLASTNPKIDKDGDGMISSSEAESVTSIPSFMNNKVATSFDELKYFKNVVQLQTSCFSHSKIKSVDLSNITTLSTLVFYDSAMEEIRLTKVKEIPNGAGSYGATGVFRESPNLTKVYLGAVTKVGTFAFSTCLALRELYETSNIVSIGQNAFYKCPLGGKIELPNIEELGSASFFQCNELAEVVIGDKLISIQDGNNTDNSDGTFRNCTNLEKVSFGYGLRYIGRNAFYGDTNLKYVEGIENVETFKSGSFRDCAIQGTLSLKNAHVVETTAFYGTNIEKLIIGEAIQEIQAGGSSGTYGGFGNCSNLKTIICMAATPPNTHSNAFNGTNNVQDVYVPDASVEVYKTTTGWTKYASKIKPLSSYDGEL